MTTETRRIGLIEIPIEIMHSDDSIAIFAELQLALRRVVRLDYKAAYAIQGIGPHFAEVCINEPPQRYKLILTRNDDGELLTVEVSPQTEEK